MQIDVYSDMVCPWCYIGKKYLKDALAIWSGGAEVQIRFRSFQLDPTLPPEGLPFREALSAKMGPNADLTTMLEHVTKAGAAVGLALRFDQITRMPNTLLAHQLVTLLPQHEQEQLVDAIMRAYFEEASDIAQLDVLLEIAQSLGHDATILSARLNQGEGAEQVAEDTVTAQQIGVRGVPFFVLNNKYALSGAYPAPEIVKALTKAAVE
jgi:predicted DsbA family dithiol-disulfide isomerase